MLFRSSINAQAVVFGAVFALAFGFLYGNFRLADRGVPSARLVFGQTVEGQPMALDRSGLLRLGLIGSLALAGMLAVSDASNWMAWISYFRAVPFGQHDPLFGRDVAFYVFRLPILSTLQQQGFLLAVVALIGCGLIYMIGGSVVAESRYGIAFWPRLRLGARARRHLTLLLTVALVLLAWGAWLDLARTLVTPGSGDTSAVVFGASYRDVHATIPVQRLKLVIASLAALLALANAVREMRGVVPLSLAAYVVVTIGGGLYGGIVQQFVVTPNEQDKEQPYIVHLINATRKAFALDAVDERELIGDAELTAKDIVEIGRAHV